MKLLILAPPNNPHTIKWVKGIAESSKFQIKLFGLEKINHSSFDGYQNISFETFAFSKDFVVGYRKKFSKLAYLKAIPTLKRIIKSFNPDLVHAHYLSSYGLLGYLTGFKPFFVSVWGIDIYDFPELSFLHRFVTKRILHKADRIFSTSYVMKTITKKYTNKKVNVIPFGIDTKKFAPKKEKTLRLFPENQIVIGTIKALEVKYGVDYLIKAFKLVKEKYENVKLLIVGDGKQKECLENLVSALALQNDVLFTGYIDSENISVYYNELDIYVALSVFDSESFGVAVLEASSSEKPVIVSNVGGLPEVVENDITGFVVPPRNEHEAAEKICFLIENSKIRNAFGRNGRKRVLHNYDFKNNLEDMIKHYNDYGK